MSIPRQLRLREGLFGGRESLLQEASRRSADNALIGRPGPKGRAILAVAAALLTLVVALSIAYAATPGGWPTTCVELNDMIEAHLGNLDKVGIYQRVHGDQAEQACQNNHRAQIQASFAWAMPTPTAATAPTQAPRSTPGQSSAVGGPPTVPRDLRVERSGSSFIVITGPPADGGGLPLLGYRWSITGATTRSGVVASSGGGFTLRLDHLQPGDYEVTVIAYNANGESPPAVTRISTPHCQIELEVFLNAERSVLVRYTNTGNRDILRWTARYIVYGEDEGPWRILGGSVAVGHTGTFVLWYRPTSERGAADPSYTPDMRILGNPQPICRL